MAQDIVIRKAEDVDTDTFTRKRNPLGGAPLVTKKVKKIRIYDVTFSYEDPPGTLLLTKTFQIVLERGATYMDRLEAIRQQWITENT